MDLGESKRSGHTDTRLSVEMEKKSDIDEVRVEELHEAKGQAGANAEQSH